MNIVTSHSNSVHIALSIVSGNQNVLTISADGDINYFGPPSNAARKFISAFKGHLDLTVVGNRAMSRSYKRALERCLRDIRNLTKEEFIELLENELLARESKEVWQTLTEKED